MGIWSATSSWVGQARGRIDVSTFAPIAIWMGTMSTLSLCAAGKVTWGTRVATAGRRFARWNSTANVGRRGASLPRKYSVESATFGRKIISLFIYLYLRLLCVIILQLNVTESVWGYRDKICFPNRVQIRQRLTEWVEFINKVGQILLCANQV